MLLPVGDIEATTLKISSASVPTVYLTISPTLTLPLKNLPGQVAFPAPSINKLSDALNPSGNLLSKTVSARKLELNPLTVLFM